MDLLRQFQHLKLILSSVVQNAQTVAHNLPDHNHNAEEAKRTFTRVGNFSLSQKTTNCGTSYFFFFKMRHLVSKL